jgi:hypothetical protein
MPGPGAASSPAQCPPPQRASNTAGRPRPPVADGVASSPATIPPAHNTNTGASAGPCPLPSRTGSKRTQRTQTAKKTRPPGRRNTKPRGIKARPHVGDPYKWAHTTKTPHIDIQGANTTKQ